MATRFEELRNVAYMRGIKAVGGIKGTNPELSPLLNDIEYALSLILQNPQTGAPNYLQLKIDSEERRKNSSLLKGYIAYTDIDNFKQFNDRYGHKTGDIVLETVVNTLLRNLRMEDFVTEGKEGESVPTANGYHEHGEEKLALLYTKNDEDAIAVMERYRKNIESNSERLCGHKVTETIGLTRQEQDESLEKTIHRADIIMQYAKMQGKNRTLFMDREQFEKGKIERAVKERDFSRQALTR